MATVGEIAADIYNTEFNDLATGATGARIEGISGWLEANVGQLNNLLYSSFSTSGDFLLEEASIFTQLYLKDYYNREARVIMSMSTTGASLDWSRLTEGDTTIVRTNRIDLSRTYRNLAKDAAEEIKDLAYAYNSYQSMPRQNAGFDGGFVSGSGYWRYPPYII